MAFYILHVVLLSAKANIPIYDLRITTYPWARSAFFDSSYKKKLASSAVNYNRQVSQDFLWYLTQSLSFNN